MSRLQKGTNISLEVAKFKRYNIWKKVRITYDLWDEEQPQRSFAGNVSLTLPYSGIALEEIRRSALRRSPGNDAIPAKECNGGDGLTILFGTHVVVRSMPRRLGKWLMIRERRCRGYITFR